MSEQPEPDAAEVDTTEAPKARRARRKPAVNRPFPRRTLEDALRVPRAIKENNGGKPWAPDQIAASIGMGMSGAFYYLTATARDHGLTEGTRDASEISITELGRKAVYPASPEEESETLLKAFFKIDIFRKVVEHFGGSKLPEARFLTNTLQTTFGLDETVHAEFVSLFEKNCRFVGIGADYDVDTLAPSTRPRSNTGTSAETVTFGADNGDGKVCFVIMPFSERDDSHAIGFFEEVLISIFTPAISAAGFTVKTAKRQGSDVIQSTIVTELLAADLVLADLTEHNPNVLFELGMRMAEDRPIALVRAKGTGAIFDVDNLLRVEDYNPNLWTSTVEKDVPRLTAHLLAAWENRDTAQTYMKILGARS